MPPARNRPSQTARRIVSRLARAAILLAGISLSAAPGIAAAFAAHSEADSVRSDAGDDWILDEIEPLFIGDDSTHAPPLPDTLDPCGGMVPCDCGDRLVESYEMSHDLTGCGGLGLVIGADSIVLDCAGHAIEGTGPGTAVWMPHSRGVTIRGCDLRNFRVGLLVRDTETLLVRDNRFIGNRVSAIWASMSKRIAIEENYFEENGRTGIGQRIGAIATLQETNESRIEGNTAEHNGNRYEYVGGIVLYESARDSILGNTLYDTGEDNIWIRFGGGHHEISGNTIAESEMDGIWIRESDENVVEGNLLTDIDLYGIYVRSAYRNRIIGNRIERAGRRAHAGIGIGGHDSPSSENIVAANEVRESLEGICVHEHAHDNYFSGDLLAGNRTGLYIGNGLPGHSNEVVRSRIEESLFRDIRMLGEQTALVLVSSEFDPDLIDLYCYGIDCRIEVRWQVDLRVESEGGGPISGAEVTLRDNTGGVVFMGTSAEDGSVPPIVATDYVLDENGRTDLNDHILDVRKEGFAAATLPFTIDRDTSETIVLAADQATAVYGTRAGALTLDVAQNPVDASSSIRFAIPAAARVRLDLYDVRGRLVSRAVDSSFGAGAHVISWSEITGGGGAPIPSGTYFARIVAGERSITRKVVVTGR